MRAVVAEDGVLRVIDAPIPTKKDDNGVLVKIMATAINRADMLQASGKYPSPDGNPILGLELAGEVVEAPSTSWAKPGDRVMSLMTSGGNAGFARVPESLLMPIPQTLTYLQAPPTLTPTPTLTSTLTSTQTPTATPTLIDLNPFSHRLLPFLKFGLRLFSYFDPPQRSNLVSAFSSMEEAQV